MRHSSREVRYMHVCHSNVLSSFRCVHESETERVVAIRCRVYHPVTRNRDRTRVDFPYGAL